MENYWYITKGTKYPKKRHLVSMIVSKRYIIIELTAEADTNSSKECNLIYLGFGIFDDIKIQQKLLQVQKGITNGN